MSVGVGDLTMCMLAVDSESHRVAGYFDPAAPAVVELLEHIASTTRSAGVFAPPARALVTRHRLYEYAD